MRYLVTGATGFIGTRLCKALADEGHAVVMLTRHQRSSAISMYGKIIQWADPLATLPPAEAFEGIDGLIHLAGESVSGRWTAEMKRAISESRLLSTRNLVSQIVSLASKPKVLVSASAIGYYGDRGGQLLTEKSASGSDFLSQVCQEWEAEASRVNQFGIRSVQLRIGIVLGEGGGALSAMLLPFRLGFGGPLGSGRQWWSWVHIDDVAGLIIHALTQDNIHGAVNATAPNPIKQSEFAKTLGRVLKRPAFLPMPGFAVRSILGEFSSELLSSKRVLPEVAMNSGYQFRFTELETALRSILRPNLR